MEKLFKTLTQKRIIIIYYIILACTTGLVGYASLGKGFDFDVVFETAGDGFSVLAFIKGIQENGFVGAWFNDRIGAPEVSALIDFPGMGNLEIIIFWILSLFTESTTKILYTFLILSFILDGISMSVLMRKLNLNMEVSFVFSCLFSFAPFHFYRYLGHSSLILYVSVPISLYLGAYVAGIIDEDKKWKLITASIILGIGYGYYYAFGLIILAMAYLIGFIGTENKKEILGRLWIGGAVLVTVFVGLLPKITYSLFYGGNLEAGQRVFYEQEIYGLKIINLLLPVTYSRIDFFRNLTNSYITSGAPLVTENYTASLGFVGSVGFILLCFALIFSLINKTKCNSKEWKLIDYLSLLTASFVLIGAIGGFGEIFNWLVTATIRCYNRSSIILTCTSLMMVAILVNKVKIKSNRLSIIVCVLILFVGMYDQVKVSSDNWQAGLRDTQTMYETYFEKVEDNLSDNAMVYQLPYMRYPENGPVHNMPDYKPFVGYVFTDNLRWSYGAVRGRNERAGELNIDEGMSYNFLAGIKEEGFDAVYIDLDGYADGGERIMEFYNGLGIQPIVSGDAKIYLYDISELNIEEIQLKPGYTFVKAWADKYNERVSENELNDIVEGLGNMDTAAYLALYNWFAANGSVSNTTDQEYVDCMYNELLNRGESDEERADWVMQIQNGMSRQEVFYSFLNSEEFRSGKGLILGN